MSAEIVDLAAKRPGNPNVAVPVRSDGVRESLISVLSYNLGGEVDLLADCILIDFEHRGFKVVPVDPE